MTSTFITPNRNAVGFFDRALTRAPRVAAVLLAAAWASAPSEAVAQSEPRSVNAVTISSPAAGDTFKRGETITVTVNFNRDINNQASCGWANPLRLEVQIGSTTRNFRCPGGNAIYGRDHPFSYVVQAGDLDADGISIAAGAIVGGTWWAPGLNPISTDLGAHAITNSANHKVDGGGIEDDEAPARPAEVTGVRVSPRDAALHVSWSAAGGEVSQYRVDAADTSGKLARRVYTDADVFEALVDRLVNGVEYTVTVTALTSHPDVEGPASEPRTAAPGAPAAPVPAVPAAWLGVQAVLLLWCRRRRGRMPRPRPRAGGRRAMPAAGGQ